MTRACNGTWLTGQLLTFELLMILWKHKMSLKFLTFLNIEMVQVVVIFPQGRQGLTHPAFHDDVIKWKHFPHYWPFVWGIHRSPVDSPHKGQWCRALMFSLIYAWTNSWGNNWDRCFQMPSCSLWHQCNAVLCLLMPGHQQAEYWPSSPRMLQDQYQKG